MLAQHFKRRHYPMDLIEDAIIRARRLDRDVLLHPTTPAPPTTSMENLFLVSHYNPDTSPLKEIVNNHWSLLGRSSCTESLYNKSVIYGHKRNKNLRDILVQAKIHQQADQHQAQATAEYDQRQRDVGNETHTGPVSSLRKRSSTALSSKPTLRPTSV